MVHTDKATRLQSSIVYLEAYTDEQMTKVSYGTIFGLSFAAAAAAKIIIIIIIIMK